MANSVATKQSVSSGTSSTAKTTSDTPTRTKDVLSDKPTKPTTAATQKITKPATESQKTAKQPPAGEAYVIQLGALNNVDKVNQLVAVLTMANYRVYTQPRTPVAGKVTRIFVGPDVSRQNLEDSLPRLKELTGLKGIIKKYSISR